MWMSNGLGRIWMSRDIEWIKIMIIIFENHDGGIYVYIFCRDCYDFLEMDWIALGKEEKNLRKEKRRKEVKDKWTEERKRMNLRNGMEEYLWEEKESE